MTGLTVRHCLCCDATYVPESQWHGAVRAIHRRHGARNLCSPCYRRIARLGTIDEWPKLTRRWNADVAEDWAFLRDSGASLIEAAQRMGMTPAALDRALHRALNRGDEQARHTGCKLVKTVGRAA